MDNDKYFPPPPPSVFPLKYAGLLHALAIFKRKARPTNRAAKVDDELHIYHVKVTDRSK